MIETIELLAEVDFRNEHGRFTTLSIRKHNGKITFHNRRDYYSEEITKKQMLSRINKDMRYIRKTLMDLDYFRDQVANHD